MKDEACYVCGVRPWIIYDLIYCTWVCEECKIESRS